MQSYFAQFLIMGCKLMKILFVTGTFPPRKFGGVTSVSYNLSKKLVERGHNVTVYTTDVGDGKKIRLNVQKTEVRDGINIHYFRNIVNSLAFKHRIFLPVSMIFSMRKHLKEYDIIHIHDFRSLLSVITYYYASKYNIPYIVQAHGSLPYWQRLDKKKIFDKICGLKILKNASRLIALTEVESKQYQNMSVGAERIELIPNGIEFFEHEISHRNFRDKHKLKKSDIIILFLSRLNKIKGIDLLIDAFNGLMDESNNLKLLIVGPDDGFLAEIKKKIKNLMLEDKVLLIGPLYGKKKFEAFSNADVYVLPSIYEAFGNTVIEAMYCSVPVIVTNGCAIGNVIDKKSGFMVKRDVTELKNAIHNIINDSYLRKSFGVTGRKMVENDFSLDKQVVKIEKIYEQCLNE